MHNSDDYFIHDLLRQLQIQILIMNQYKQKLQWEM